MSLDTASVDTKTKEDNFKDVDKVTFLENHEGQLEDFKRWNSEIDRLI